MLLNFLFYSGLIIPTIIALIDKFIENDFFLVRVYLLNIINIYFIMLLHAFAYYFVLRRINFIKKIFQDSN